ncbi:MAG: ABC transporter ATP-binding protein, partial [Clostridia bacterium]
MLELKNIKKTYKVGDIETKALDGISVSFAKKEFVAILGASGSGKTTALNIIGGLDHYDSGDLIIKGKSTKNFTAYEWDAYRNNSIGFVFQSYNLISHLSIVDNVELGMTLSGVNREQKHKKALEVLGQVGLKDHLHKKPNQLSGGQMQRVAIARALANDPKILLCDEPTGALDSVTSIQILELIKNVAKDRLVIMVTHNPALAEKYADRIIQFEDGKIVSDTNPYIEKEKNADFNLTRTSMSYLTAIRLSFNNLRTKKGRTFLTAFASSIGIIGIAVILSLSSGFQSEIDKFQEDAMAEFPVFISKTTQEINKDELADKSLDFYDRVWGSAEYVDEPNIVITDEASKIVKHTNDFTNEFMDYIAKISPEICGSIGYTRIVRMNLVKKDADGYKYASLLPAGNGNKGGQMMMTSTSGMGLSCYPKSVGGNEDYLKKNYELISGNYPNSPTEVVLIVDTKMQIDKATLQTLG